MSKKKRKKPPVGKFLLRIVAGANVATIVLLLFVAYSDRIDPVSHPLLACAGMLMPVALLLNLAFFVFWLVVKWRWAWIALVGFVLVYEPITIYMPLRVKADPPADAIRVLSYNVHGFSGMHYGENTFDTIISYIERFQPHILCMQEATDTWRHSDTTMARLFAYNDTIHINRTKRQVNVVSVHSRYPIVGHELIETESVTEMNGAAAFYLDVGGDTLLVVNAHLENIHLNTEDRETYKSILKGEMDRDTAQAEGLQLIDKLAGAFRVRAPQARALHDYIERHRQGKSVLVCGDFNDTPISYSRRTVAEGLTDCYQESGCGVGLSYNQKGFNFRIDHVLCSADLVPVRCEVDTKFRVSDHYPVLCWLKKRDNP
jgi:endonuclease/exonuclease/phosphatase (EEP) superfamily protein YafD